MEQHDVVTRLDRFDVAARIDVALLDGLAAGRGRRRMGATVMAAAAVVAVVGVGASTVWSTIQPVEPAPILDRPEVNYEPWEGQSIDATLFLCDGARCPAITDEQQADLYLQLLADPTVETVYFESKQDSYERFVEQAEQLQPELVESVEPDLFPAALRVRLTDPRHAAAIVEGFSAAPGVEEVQERHDTSNPPG